MAEARAEIEKVWQRYRVTRDQGLRDRLILNYAPLVKYVVSSTLTEATWRNSKIVGPYDPDAIRSLKERVEGDLYVSGSGTLVRAMLADGLVDELHLFVFPLTRGSGPRLFPDGDPPRKLGVARTETYPNGVVYLAYRPES